MDTFKDSRRVDSRNVIIYPVDEPLTGGPRIGSSGFYQFPKQNPINDDHHLTFDQLFDELGQSFQWISYELGKPLSTEQNKYASGLVLVSMNPTNTAPGTLNRASRNRSSIVHLSDFSREIVPIGEYLLVHHNINACNDDSGSESYGSHRSGSDNSALSALCCSLRALSSDSGHRDPETGKLPSCIRGVPFDLNQTNQIYYPSTPHYPRAVVRKRRRIENNNPRCTIADADPDTNTNAMMSAPMDLPEHGSSFRAEVRKRDQCCRLTGQINHYGSNEEQVGPAIDVCRIVPCGSWTPEMSLSAWSVRQNANLDPHQLYANDCENGICLRRDLGHLFAEFLWSVDPDTLKIRVFVNMESLIPFHGQDIRVHQRDHGEDSTDIGGDPPLNVWGWHYTQCVLRMLRATEDAPGPHDRLEEPEPPIPTDRSPKNNRETAPGISFASSHRDTKAARWRYAEPRNLSGRPWGA